MNTHLVHIKSSSLEQQFHIEGSFNPAVEELLRSSIDHFYEITAPLVERSGIAKIYTVRLDPRGGNNFASGNKLNLNPLNLSAWTVTHELAHALDAAHNWQLSQQMRKETGSGFLFKSLHYTRPAWKVFWYRVGSPPPPCGVDKNFNSLEDFAETVTAYIYPDEARRRAEARGYAYERWGYTHFHDTPRGKFFENLIRPVMEQRFI